jgi:hypothetical protein
MKKLFLITALSVVTMLSFAQGKGNGKGKYKNNKTVHTTGVFNNQSTGDKYSKNLPAKVRESFNRDYPNSNNVVWTKSKGVWTARYNGGIFGNPQIVSYKANGRRM